MNEEQFKDWMVSNYVTCTQSEYSIAQAAWNEATKQERERCIAICGNTHDYLVEAMRK